jgi:hypothetical protein
MNRIDIYTLDHYNAPSDLSQTTPGGTVSKLSFSLSLSISLFPIPYGKTVSGNCSYSALEE